MDVERINYKILSPSNFSMPLNLPICTTCSLQSPNSTLVLDPHLLSLLLAHQLDPPSKLPVVLLFATHHLTSGINFLTYFVSLFIFISSTPSSHLTSVIITTLIIHRPHHSSFQTSKKTSFFSNPTLHRHLAPLRTDFTDIQTALRLFLRFSFFLVSVIVISFLFNSSTSGLLSLP